MKILKTLTAVMALLITFSLAETAMAEEGTIYGPVYLSRGDMSHHHGGTTLTFTAPVAGEGVVVITNGGDSGKKSRVSSAKIKFNGEKIASPRKFNKKVHEIRIDVDLLLDNEMKVKIKSCKRCELEIYVTGELATVEPAVILPVRLPVR
jgi:hypothetical protein